MTSPLTSKLHGFGTSIFAEVNAFAARHGAVNLGQGAPNFDGPEFVKAAAVEALQAGHNQYAPAPGVPELRQAIAEHQERFYGLTVDPETEVTITAGATEAIFTTVQALFETGDEMIVFEPFYDSYRPALSMAGATIRPVRLHGPEFRFDLEELRAAVGPKTRAILINTPHNPTGTVFSRTELEQIAELCRKHDLIALADEVYEHLVFAGEHIPIASLDGMSERTVTISSGGKTFSVTGWKIGWTIAAPALTSAIRTAHQFVTFCIATPLQHGVAAGLRAEDEYYDDYLRRYRVRRDQICSGLEEAGFGVIEPAGTYFVMADIRPLGFDDDRTLCRALVEQAGVAAIPASAFYLEPSEARFWLRFGFCKTRESLDEGLRRLKTFSS